MHPNRPRRLRIGNQMRRAVQDVHLTLDDMIYPMFIRDADKDYRSEIKSMPGQAQLSPELAAEMILDLTSKGLKQFVLFGIVDKDQKDEVGSASYVDNNPVLRTARLVREQDKNREIILIGDVCFCEYTSHGHCGHLHDDPRITVDNDITIDGLGRQSVIMAENGFDMVAPSAMMDGMVSAIRGALDEAGQDHIPIMSYAVKFASNMYGPFREAAEGAPQFGDRKSYQADFRRTKEWQTEFFQDIAEGADILMVKPAHAYLDILAQMRASSELPMAAYHVSGEYSMIHAAAANGWIDLEKSALEVTYAMKRAGADLILTYFAKDMVEWLG